MGYVIFHAEQPIGRVPSRGRAIRGSLFAHSCATALCGQPLLSLTQKEGGYTPQS
jgi:hypothetical protein